MPLLSFNLSRGYLGITYIYISAQLLCTIRFKNELFIDDYSGCYFCDAKSSVSTTTAIAIRIAALLLDLKLLAGHYHKQRHLSLSAEIPFPADLVAVHAES